MIREKDDFRARCQIAHRDRILFSVRADGSVEVYSEQEHAGCSIFLSRKDAKKLRKWLKVEEVA